MKRQAISVALLLSFLAFVVGLNAASLSIDPQHLQQQADDQFAHGRYDAAARLYRQLVELPALEPTRKVYARFQLGLSWFKQGESSKAFQVWQQMRWFFPHNVYAPQSLWLEAEAPGHPHRSDQLRDQILKLYPRSPEAATVLIRRGQEACDQKYYQLAASCWSQLLAEFPKHPSASEIRDRLEMVQLASTGSQESIDHLQGENLLRRADALFDHAAFEQAARFYQKYIDQSFTGKDASRAVVRLAQCLMAQDRPRDAFETLRQAAERSPAEAPALLVEMVSQAASRREGDGLRLRATQLILDRYPNSFEAQQALYIAGFVEMTRRHPPKAREWWGQLLARYPDTGFRAAIERQLSFTVRSMEARVEPTPSMEEQRLCAPAPAAKKRPTEEQLRREQRLRWQSEARAFAQIYGDPSASGEQRAEAVFQMAERSLSLQQYATAAQQFQRVWNEFPKSARAEQAAFELAQMWFAAGEEKKGNGQLRFVIERFPSSSWRPMALYCLGNREILYAANVEAGWACYHQLLTEYPDHPLSEPTRKFWALLNQYTPKNLEDSLRRLQQQTPSTPTS